jgi:hypothetical protein
MNPSKLILVIGLLLIVGIASAVPTTGAATLIGSNNVTVSGTGFTGDAWFVWGQVSTSEYWTTPHRASSYGLSNYTISQSPLFGSTVFYFRACDSTGCGNQRSFTTLPVTPIPDQNIGGVYQNMTESGYDIPMMGSHLIDPYLWSGSPITIIFFLMFSPIFIGVWLRSRTVLVALILAFVVGSFILFADSTTAIGIMMPTEIVDIAQALCYISFAGAVLYIVHR